VEPLLELVFARWPHDAVDFCSVAEKDERRPELDSEGSSEALAFAVFDPHVLHVWMRAQRAID
jgi:hypothetical protein